MFYIFIIKHTEIFVEKMREAFAMQKLLSFFQQKSIGVFQILMFEIFNKTLTNDVVSFEQRSPDKLIYLADVSINPSL